MKVAYFDCFSGISGDMIIGALIDAGLSPDLLIQEISKLNIEGLDKNKLISNIKIMQSFATKYKKQLRPHAKTHKCTEICKIQKQYGCSGISITKPSEDLEIVNSNIKNILITSPIVTSRKLDILRKILEIDANTIVVVMLHDY